MEITLDEYVINQVADAQYFMLRYETEFTPCTGITAVTKMERRHFSRGVMISPWCPNMNGNQPVNGVLRSGSVKNTGWSFKLKDRLCRVLVTADPFLPIFFVEIEGCFQGIEDPYNVPLSDLHRDVLFYGLAVQKILKTLGRPDQFVWGADWESVPALSLARKNHLIALTIHNTFDECLEHESREFGSIYMSFYAHRRHSGMSKTALEIGLSIADVVTTVNRGFAYGLLHEAVQTEVMANHLQHLLTRVVGIDNAAFSHPSELAVSLKKEKSPATRQKLLFEGQYKARASLPDEIRQKINGKVLIVSMGRRVSQKLHDVVIEAARQILHESPDLPVFFFFPTKRGDVSSTERLERIEQLQNEFPENAWSLDGDCPFYPTLMQAADYNCMASLYEPHGGAYEGTVVPIARAIDGLAEQICGYKPLGAARLINDLWHEKTENATGFLFREEPSTDVKKLVSDLKELLASAPSDENSLFKEIVASLKSVLMQAIRLRIEHPEQYEKLVNAAVHKQDAWTWEQNLEAILNLVEAVRENPKSINRPK